ncbi:ATP-binding protein, partial [Azospirillum sp. C340-1]|nr:ATP-binding protein [Azospirillum isscasi]
TFQPGEPAPPRLPVPRPSPSARADLLARLARPRPVPAEPAPFADEAPAAPVKEPETPEQAAEREAAYEAILREVLADPEASYRSIAVLFQDFLVRCRAREVRGDLLELPAFRRKLAAARAGAGQDTEGNPAWEKATQVAATLPEDIQVVFLLLARAALDHLPCPSDADVARACGSRSRGRARRLLTYMEQRGFIATRSGLGNTRSIALPALGWETALGDPNADDGTDGPEDGGLFATA